MKLSIIIPVYNTAQFLDRCIESIYKDNPLDTADFEVICVNDGSTDQSDQILGELANKHHNIRVLRQDNSGQSVARNRALEVACGDYVYFLDSDDYIDASALAGSLMASLKKNAEMTIVDYVKVDEAGRRITKQDRNSYEKLSREVTGAELLSEYTVRGAVCSYLCRRDRLEVNKLRFTEGIYLEDEEFMIKLISKCTRIYNSREQVYYYTQRNGSTVNPMTPEKESELLNSLFYISKSIQSLSKKKSDPLVSQGLSKKAAQLSISFILMLRHSSLKKEEKRSLLFHYLGSSLYPIRVRELNLPQRLFSLFANQRLFLELYVGAN